MKTKKNPQGRHRENGDYMLTGKLYCANCGSFMVGISGTGRNGLHYYYACQKRRNKNDCKKKNVPRDWIERVVVQYTLNYVLRPDVIQWIADAVMAYQEREAASFELESLLARQAENQKSTANLVKAIEAGVLTVTTKKRLLELETEAAELQRAIQVEQASHVHLERDQIVYWLERFQGGSVDSLEFRRKVIDTFVSAVYLSDAHIRIAFNYSGKNNKVDLDLIMNAADIAGLDDSFKLSGTPPKQHNPNLMPIGDGFGFLIFPSEVEK